MTGFVDEFRQWLSYKLHMWATMVYDDDFHTWKLTAPNGEVVTFSCYWQHTGSWSDYFTETCSCEEDV